MPFDEPDRDQLLATYLNDHLMGASAGVDLFRRVAGGYSDHDTRGQLSELADEVADDRDSLLVIMAQLDIKPQTHRMIAGRLVEKVGRLKMNGTVLKRSPLTDLIELEGLRIGVEGKLAMWRALQAGLHDDRVVPTEVDASDPARGGPDRTAGGHPGDRGPASVRGALCAEGRRPQWFRRAEISSDFDMLERRLMPTLRARS